MSSPRRTISSTSSNEGRTRGGGRGGLVVSDDLLLPQPYPSSVPAIAAAMGGTDCTRASRLAMASQVESFFLEDVAVSQPGRRSGAGGGAAAAACTSGKDPTRWSLRHSSIAVPVGPASASGTGGGTNGARHSSRCADQCAAWHVRAQYLGALQRPQILRACEGANDAAHPAQDDASYLSTVTRSPDEAGNITAGAGPDSGKGRGGAPRREHSSQ